jgi:leucyl aminopeptidase
MAYDGEDKDPSFWPYGRFLMTMLPVFLPRARKASIPVYIIHFKALSVFLKKQPGFVAVQVREAGFEARPERTLLIYNEKAQIWGVLAGVHAPVKTYDLAHTADMIARTAKTDMLETTSFELHFANKPAKGDVENACIGWGLAGYHFSTYKKTKPVKPALLWPAKVDKRRVEGFVQAVYLIRDLINTPANDMGPDELEAAARAVAKDGGAKIAVIKDKQLLDQNFPMIYAVGQASDRRPRLIDLTWGSPKHKTLTLVGKGVCFDTGGLDIKPSSGMLMMKKDMGGAAHVLGLAHVIMALKLPVRLRVLIPAVENSIAGNAFRPWDILKSRKGLTVEVGNTDAEGRLVLADALSLACEDKPDLLIDCATLTGAARIALGYDVPGLFSNNDRTLETLKTLSMELNDPLWPLPLWPGYRRDLESAAADISSTGNGGMAGAITAALFLKEFVEEKTEWVHLDMYAWESSGRPGKPRGGTDMGLRTLLALIEKRYRRKKA